LEGAKKGGKKVTPPKTTAYVSFLEQPIEVEEFFEVSNRS